MYAGEGFEEVAESFFGFMERDGEQAAAPYEPRTVRMKSDLRGAGRVALPLVFRRDDAGGWTAKWMHLFLRGAVNFNMVETNKVSTGHDRPLDPRPPLPDGGRPRARCWGPPSPTAVRRSTGR